MRIQINHLRVKFFCFFFLRAFLPKLWGINNIFIAGFSQFYYFKVLIPNDEDIPEHTNRKFWNTKFTQYFHKTTRIQCSSCKGTKNSRILIVQTLKYISGKIIMLTCNLGIRPPFHINFTFKAFVTFHTWTKLHIVT